MREFSGLFHLALHVSDLQKSIEFYGKLGYEYVFSLKLPDGTDRDWLAYVRVSKDQYLELFQIYSDHPLLPRECITHKPDDNFAHFSILVPDIYKAALDWAKEGIRVVYAPFKNEPIPLEDDSVIRGRIGADRNYICWIEDPDGNWIEVMEQLPDSWQKVYEEKNPL